jgi:stearoyl-CoA desaturase (delta-9 desaturase)
MAVLGCTAGQRGPLWWAAHHREHHIASDTDQDPHSPARRGFLFSHTLWFLTRGSFATPAHRVRDWLRYPELRWLERLDWLPFVALAAACFALGTWLETNAPELGSNGPQMLVWGFFISTVALYHATYTINSLAHRFGSRRYATSDDSRNNAWLALITLGEGWHNNHHYFPSAARQGFFWWEIDMSFIGLRALALLGIVHDLRPVPAHVLAGERRAGVL